MFGSVNMLQTLFKADLVDALELMIIPVTLGPGKRLFADGSIPGAFKVTGSFAAPSGVIIVNYERARSRPEVIIAWKTRQHKLILVLVRPNVSNSQRS
jgi:dihydrofolate reductase